LFEETDQFGIFVTCLQCGFSKDIHDPMVESGAVSLEPVPAPMVPKGEGGKRRRLSLGGRHFSKTFARLDDADLGKAA